MLLALLVCLSSACESDERAPASAVVDPDRPCALASTGEIARAVGSETSAPSPLRGHSKDGTILCSYGVGDPFTTVSVHVEDDVSEDEFVDRMARDPLNTDELDDVDAGALAYTHGGATVSVWEDGSAVSASVQHLGDRDETREALERLAELIDSKL